MIIWSNRLYPKPFVSLRPMQSPIVQGVGDTVLRRSVENRFYNTNNHTAQTSQTVYRDERVNRAETQVYQQNRTSQYVETNPVSYDNRKTERYMTYDNRRSEQNTTYDNRSSVHTEETGGNVIYQTQVQVEVVNHNQIHGEQDMERLAETFAESLYQSLLGSEGVAL